MSNRPDPLEFEYLQDVYRRTCEAFERGELSSFEARDTIVGVTHVDRHGAIWKVDIARSGRRAAFVKIGNQPKVASGPLIPPGLAALDLEYQDICAAFNEGVITSDMARQQVMALRFTDPDGFTWMVDRQRSGKSAAFVEDPDAPRVARHLTVPSEPFERDTSTADVARQVRLGNEKYSSALNVDHDTTMPPQLRVKEIGVVASVLLGGLVLLLGFSGDGDKPTVAVSTTTPIVSPIPTIPDNSSVSFSKLSDFTDRSSIPNDTEIEFGRSVMNRPLTFIRRGNPNGVRVVVVGVIHGDEFAGLAVTDILKSAPPSPNIDLWILPMLNPDGYDLKTRQNANKVDLNRNFPNNWKTIEKVGYWQWSGPSPASEPEVKAMLNLGDVIQPELTIWYHQDYFRISPGSGRDGAIRKRYANLVDLPLLKIKGGSYSGTAAMWSETMNKNDTTSLTVEFGKGLRSGEAQANAAAVVTVVNEFFPE